MDIQAASEFARKMRNLSRRAVIFRYDRQAILKEINDIAKNYEEVADRLEMEMVEEMEEEWTENSQ